MKIAGVTVVESGESGGVPHTKLTSASGPPMITYPIGHANKFLSCMTKLNHLFVSMPVITHSALKKSDSVAEPS